MLHPKKQVDSKRTTATRINKHTNLPNTTRKLYILTNILVKLCSFRITKSAKGILEISYKA